MPTPQFIQLYQHNAAAVAQELLQGLSAPQAFTSPKYLYDALGSRLFEAITELPEFRPCKSSCATAAALCWYSWMNWGVVMRHIKSLDRP